jgi:hypothetical protein
MSLQPPSPGGKVSRANFALPRVVGVIVSIEALILLAAAIQLFFFPLWEGLRWPWALSPYNAVFLGAIYWAALAAVGTQVFNNRWSPARVIQWIALGFSGILLLVSIGYIGQFDWQRKLVKAWFVVYTLVPFSAAAILLRYRRQPPVDTIRISSRRIRYFKIKSGILALYGLALLVLPDLFTVFWPWPIDAFHARLYSAIFIAPALGNWLLSSSAAVNELLVLGSLEFLVGVLPLIGIAYLDRILKLIDWSAAGYWVWVGLFLLWTVVGAELIRFALVLRSPTRVNQ